MTSALGHSDGAFHRECLLATHPFGADRDVAGELPRARPLWALNAAKEVAHRPRADVVFAILDDGLIRDGVAVGIDDVYAHRYDRFVCARGASGGRRQEGDDSGYEFSIGLSAEAQPR